MLSTVSKRFNYDVDDSKLFSAVPRCSARVAWISQWKAHTYMLLNKTKIPEIRNSSTPHNWSASSVSVDIWEAISCAEMTSKMFAAVLIGAGISLETQLFHDISLACHIAWQAPGHVTQGMSILSNYALILYKLYLLSVLDYTLFGNLCSLLARNSHK